MRLGSAEGTRSPNIYINFLNPLENDYEKPIACKLSVQKTVYVQHAYHGSVKLYSMDTLTQNFPNYRTGLHVFSRNIMKGKGGQGRS